MLLFNIPCGKMASQLKAVLLCVIVWVTSRTNPLCRGMIGRNDHFSSEERSADKLQLFRFGHLADMFLKLKEVSFSFQGKQPTALAANDKIRMFMQKIRILEHLYLPP